MKVINVVVIGGVLVLTGKYLLSLRRAEKEVVIATTGKKDKISIQGISVLIRYNIKNPTQGVMRMTPPLLKLIVNGNLVASSNMQMIDIPEDARDKSGKIIIRAFQETGEIETRILIPWVNLLFLGPDLIARLKNADKNTQITIKVETISQVFTLVGSFPYEQTITFKV
jgi:hypothetical protein